MRPLSAFALSCALFCSLPAAEAQTYVGITGGPTRANLDCEGLSNCKSNSFGLKLYGGYKFSPNTAVEGAYTSLGTFKASGTDAALGREVSISNRLSSLSLGGAFFYEIAPQFTAVARIGLASGKVKFSSDGAAISETKINPYLGAGLGYAISPALSLNGTLDFNRFRFDGDKQNVFMLGVGLSYGF